MSQKFHVPRGTLWLLPVSFALSGIPLLEILGTTNALPCKDFKQLAQEEKSVAKESVIIAMALDASWSD